MEETTTEVETTTVKPTEQQTTKQEVTTEKETGYTVTDMDKTMYVNGGVNVRSGPSSDYKKLGSLSKGQEVKVTGKVKGSSWYRINYNNQEGFVNGKYLQDDPIQETTTVNERQQLMNSVSLTQYGCGIVEIDQMIEDIFTEIFEDGMTTYDKVKACYDYIVLNTEYAHNGFVQQFINDNDIWTYYYYKDAVHTYGLLTTGLGVCDDYSAAFAVMLRRIGVDCYTVGGQYVNSKGESGGHAWCEVNLDGQIYIFDPQVEDRVVKNGVIKYSYFFKTYDERSGNYIKEE